MFHREDEMPAHDVARLRIKVSSHRTPTAARGGLELAITAIPFALACFAMYWALGNGFVALYLLLMLPAAGLLVRLFLIQHDCGHLAFFANRSANHWVGRIISVLTLTPYDHWRHCHSIHHATSGNLGRRGVGDVDTLTVAEYTARPTWSRARYRAYRHPLVMFLIGPIFLFVVQNRFPAGFMRTGWAPWVSTMATNVAIALATALLVYFVGIGPFLLVQVPVLLLAAGAGVWLFYVQHQFEETYWEKSEQWSVHSAGLHGSSHYDLPPILRWFSANIGVHHVHHLSSGVPFYRLPDVLRENPELRAIGRLTLWQSLRCVGLVLWDEQSRRMISFRDFKRNNILTTPAGT